MSKTPTTNSIQSNPSDSENLTLLTNRIAYLTQALEIEKQWRYSNGGSDIKWIPSLKYDQLLENNAYLISKVIRLEKDIKRLRAGENGSAEVIYLDDDSDDEKSRVNVLRINEKSLMDDIIKQHGNSSSASKIHEDMVQSVLKSEASFVPTYAAFPKLKKQPHSIPSSQMFHGTKESKTMAKTLLFQGASVNQERVQAKLDQARGITQVKDTKVIEEISNTKDPFSSTRTKRFADAEPQDEPRLGRLNDFTSSRMKSTSRIGSPNLMNSNSNMFEITPSKINVTSLTPSTNLDKELQTRDGSIGASGIKNLNITSSNSETKKNNNNNNKNKRDIEYDPTSGGKVNIIELRKRQRLRDNFSKEDDEDEELFDDWD